MTWVTAIWRRTRTSCTKFFRRGLRFYGVALPNFMSTDPVVVVDLGKALPPGVFRRFTVTLSGLVLTIDFYYDSKGGGGEQCIRIAFDSVASFGTWGLFGKSFTNINYKDSIRVNGDVFEFLYSEAAIELTKLRHRCLPRIRHFEMFLPEEDQFFRVFAAECHACDLPTKETQPATESG